MIFNIKGFRTIAFIFIVIVYYFQNVSADMSSGLLQDSRVRQTLEGRRTYRPKRFGNNNTDEDNSLKTLMIKINSSISNYSL